MKRLSAFVIAAVFVSTGVAATSPHPRVIYGEDNRLDIYEIQKEEALWAAQVTVVIADNERLVKHSDEEYKLAGDPYGPTLNLCPDERFYNQKMSGFCSGVLVAPDVVLTAGHCIVNKKECENSSVVFDFHTQSPLQLDFVFSPRQVRGCRRILRRSVTKEGVDFELIQLNEPVLDRQPARMSSAELRVHDRVFMVGHPWGLPAKYVEGQILQSRKKFYVTDLDSSEGNSGSPVFDMSGGLLGILTEGEEDLIEDEKQQCLRSKICPQGACGGETVFQVRGVFL